MLFVGARIYRLPLAPGPVPVEAMWASVAEAASAAGLPLLGAAEPPRVRAVELLDTPRLDLRAAGLQLRRATTADGPGTLTLRVASEDRYVASQTANPAARGFLFHSSFVEEISPPFHTRYGLVTTVDLSGGHNAELARRAGLARVFPLARRAAGDAPLVPAFGRRVEERIHNGLRVDLPHPRGAPVRATLALLTWTEAGAPAAAELTLRYADRRERYDLEVCRAARRLFEALQRLPGANPAGRPKTAVLVG